MEKNYEGSWESVAGHKIPQWYEDCKLGVFIHWGIYSVPAYAPRTWQLGDVLVDENWFCNNPYAEWYFNSVNVKKGPTYEYHKKTYGEDFPYEGFIKMWQAEKWDPAQWADLFKKSGAGYVVLTAKHHDGFCLFPSQYTHANALEQGPRRDLVGELTEAVRENGLKMGLYYSGAVDWRFASDPIMGGDYGQYNVCPTFRYADYAYDQVCELIDRYQPSVFWNDIGWPKAGERALPHLLAHYYNTVPDGVVNDRFNGLYQGFSTKEYKLGTVRNDQKWELCRGMGLSFGYNAMETDADMISESDLISLLVETVANNGNLLLNVGPRADGTIPWEQEKRLLALGRWLAVNGEAIYGTRPVDLAKSYDTDEEMKLYFTHKAKAVYLFVDHAPSDQFFLDLTFLPIHGELTALEPSLVYETQKIENRRSLIVKNHKTDQHTLVFKMMDSDLHH